MESPSADAAPATVVTAVTAVTAATATAAATTATATAPADATATAAANAIAIATATATATAASFRPGWGGGAVMAAGNRMMPGWAVRRRWRRERGGGAFLVRSQIWSDMVCCYVNNATNTLG